MKDLEHFGVSQEFEASLDGDRESARRMWKLVAERPDYKESVLWVQAVAQRILDADGETDRRRRPDAILKATGLMGREDEHRRLKDAVITFHELLEPGRYRSRDQSQYLFDYLSTLPEFDEYLRTLPSFRDFGGSLEQFKTQMLPFEFSKILARLKQ